MAADVDQLREQIAAATAEVSERAAAQHQAALEVAAADADAQAAGRRGDDVSLAKAEKAYWSAVAATGAAADRVHELRVELADQGLFELVPAALPVLLLPVRLETRWKLSPSSRELLIRIYPDEVHSDTFEPELTDEEQTWGGAFWQQTNAAAADDDRKAAWAQLVGRFGPARSAWIAHATDPASIVPPGKRAAAWTRAPRTRVLPDRWTAVLTTDAQAEADRRLVHLSNVVPDTLATGPDPSAPDAPQATGMPVVDEGMRWMVEFAEAEKVGMGIRVSIPAGISEISRILVFGVKASLTGDAAALRLEELLSAHHYGDGLGFVAAGTPTNNTGDTDSGFRSRGHAADVSYAAERGPALAVAGDGSDGDLLARALGLDAGVFAHVAGADGLSARDARAMNAALWPATWGYFLEQMMAETFDEAGIESGWAHFVEFVRGGGPLPSLRTGRQPYGILPATSLAAYQPLAGRDRGAAMHVASARVAAAPGFDRALSPFLLRLRDRWRASTDGVPRLGRSADVDADLAEVLGQDAVSSRYAAQSVLGGDYLINLWSFMGFGLDPWSIFFQTAVTEGRAELASVGAADWSPRLLQAIFWSWVELNGPHVDGGALTAADERLSETAGLDDNYLTWLLESGIEAIRDEAYPGSAPPNALLYLVLRHAALRALVRASESAATTEVLELVRRTTTAVTKTAWREPELVGIDESTSTAVVWDHLEALVSVDGDSMSAGRLAEAVYRGGSGRATGVSPPSGPAFAELHELGSALAHLEQRPTAVLERTFAQSLDTGSHRLDAWMTSLATKRLFELRAGGVSGICIGAFGWLEQAHPRRTTSRPELPEGSDPDTDSGNLGYLHAPSAGQAATAAVLRAGALSHAGASGDALGIDLRSARVRLAEATFEGVRQGQPLGALLGYRFERALHDAYDATPSLELDRFIDPFRQLAPLDAGKRDPADTGAVEAIAAANVVDGLALLDLRARNGIVYGRDPLPTATTAEREAIDAALDGLADVTDALADAAVAESVHQLVQGNATRAGATLDAVATGEAPPPELHFTRTPRTGVGVVHRVSMLFSRSAAPAAIDPTQYPERAREDAEPELHAWVEQLFGPQDDVVCHASFAWPDEHGDHTSGPVRIKLSDLGLAPLDVLYASSPSEQEERTQLDQRAVLRALQLRPGSTPARAQVTLDYTRTGLGAAELSFDELLELARAARELLASAEPLTATDLMLPEEAQRGAGGVDLADLSGRADRAEARLQLIHDDLDPTATDKDELRRTILAAAVLGVQGAVPVSPVDGSVVSAVDATQHLDERDLLRGQAKSMKGELEARLDRIGLLSAPGPGAPEQAAVEFELERLTEALGPGFKVVPRFSLDPEAGDELKLSLDRSTELQDGDPAAATTWVQRAARVRAPVARLETVVLYGAALGRIDFDFEVAQLPYEATERWVGLAPETGRVQGGRLSLVSLRSTGFDARDSIAGLSIDDWVEVVPSDAEETGLTFHFDAPAAEPPQAWLLAVHPDPTVGTWDLETLEAILGETLELAELRAVDEDALRGAGQFLPAAYFATNTGGDTVSTDFMRNVVHHGRKRR
jgi:hypothetical protein